jgi:hypothetical protein
MFVRTLIIAIALAAPFSALGSYMQSENGAIMFRSKDGRTTKFTCTNTYVHYMFGGGRLDWDVCHFKCTNRDTKQKNNAVQDCTRISLFVDAKSPSKSEVRVNNNLVRTGQVQYNQRNGEFYLNMMWHDTQSTHQHSRFVFRQKKNGATFYRLTDYDKAYTKVRTTRTKAWRQ